MAGVHGLQQVECFGSADFADDDAFWPHTQTVTHQVAHGDGASPSRLGGRDSRRTTCGCCSCNSAASSQVMMRSSSSMNWVRQLSSVVLPEPVPPDTSVLTRQRPTIFRISAPCSV